MTQEKASTLSPDTAVVFHGKKIRYQSLVPVQITTHSKTDTSWVSTGFFVLDGDRRFLVSNWHVFSGRNYETGQPMHKMNAVPERLSFKARVTQEINSASSTYTTNIYSIPLYNEDVAIWKQHPAGQAVDVAAIEITGIPEEAAIVAANPEIQISVPDLRVSNEVFIVGFPGEFPIEADLPIWKRGTIAAEPLISKGRVGKILIDASTREGMSGSPVYHFTGSKILHRDGGLSQQHGAVSLIGIYSGRYKSTDKFAAEIGIIWPMGFLEEIIKSGVPGDYKIIKVAK